MKNLSKQEAVLLGVLCSYGREILRTKFVKLVYLLDNSYYEQMGSTLTGFNYHWDHFGPNTIGSALVETLSKLSSKGFVSETQKLTPYENFANYYRCSATVEMNKIPLGTLDWAFIHSALKKYGHLSRGAIVAESKRTAPMQGITQYEVLEFKENSIIQDLKRDFLADSNFVRDTRNALNPCGDIIELEELRIQLA